jgi:membrane fusion protein (multidrug efflux system)
MDEPSSELFRKEALDYYTDRSSEGTLLRISPSWLSWSYRSLGVVCAAAALYVVLGTIHEYAPGPAIVRIQGKTEVTATSAGTVASVSVQPGNRVVEGDLLIRLYQDQEVVQLESIDKRFELELAKVLRDPSDQAARAALISLRTDRELAKARLEERTVRAPRAGLVADVRIRPGQHLAPGEPIVSIVPDDAEYRVVALLPGHARPLLSKDMSLRVEMTGFRYSYHELAIESVGDQVVGPAEIRRFLGPEIADAVPLAGPVVIVTARLPRRTFEVDGRTVNFFDGMQARAEAVVRKESILLALVPALRAL